MAQFARVTDFAPRFFAIRREIETEARPYAALDWVLKFPDVVAGDSARLIRFYGVLYAAFVAAAQIGPPPAGMPDTVFSDAMSDFRDLQAARIISVADYDWYAAKLRRTKRDFEVECEVLARAAQPIAEELAAVAGLAATVYPHAAGSEDEAELDAEGEVDDVIDTWGDGLA